MESTYLYVKGKKVIAITKQTINKEQARYLTKHSSQAHSRFFIQLIGKKKLFFLESIYKKVHINKNGNQVKCNKSWDTGYLNYIASKKQI